MKKPKVTIIIPTWNGEELLRKNLFQVLDSLPKDSQVIVVENGSTDGSLQFLKEVKKKDSRLELIINQTNLGFIPACNQAAKLARGKFIALINNDVIPQKGFLPPALKHFEDPKVFAVSFRETQDQWGSWAEIFWQSGFFNYLPGVDKSDSHISGWASGGSAIFRKSVWEKLGGFDPIYQPFYWEDLDIGYRAWKSGYKIIWEPESKVEHHHESTVSKLDKTWVARVKERNQLLFIWRNITDWNLRLSHLLGLFFRVVFGPNYIKVIWMALKRYWEFRGQPAKVFPVRTDHQILEFFRQ
ncbi:MAG: glycosyltransferase family 2 protein [Patescibacteria group bacterium]